MPSFSAYKIIRIYSKVEDYETKNKTPVDARIRVRENGSSLNFNFISLLNSVVDENWVCRHHLQQFILRKWCRMWCSDLCKLFENGKFTTETFPLFCARIDLFIIFVCSPYSLWATIMLLHHFGFVCALILGYPCTHFSCHWCKIYNHGNVLRRLTQISKRQRDPLWLDHEY